MDLGSLLPEHAARRQDASEIHWRPSCSSDPLINWVLFLSCDVNLLYNVMSILLSSCYLRNKPGNYIIQFTCFCWHFFTWCMNITESTNYCTHNRKWSGPKKVVSADPWMTGSFSQGPGLGKNVVERDIKNSSQDKQFFTISRTSYMYTCILISFTYTNFWRSILYTLLLGRAPRSCALKEPG